MPDLDEAAPEQDGQQGRGYRDRAIGSDQDEPARPTVYQSADKGTEEDVGQGGNCYRDRQDGCRAGGLGQPPDERKLGQGAADQGELLPDPNGKEPRSPGCGIGL